MKQVLALTPYVLYIDADAVFTPTAFNTPVLPRMVELLGGKDVMFSSEFNQPGQLLSASGPSQPGPAVHLLPGFSHLSQPSCARPSDSAAHARGLAGPSALVWLPWILSAMCVRACACVCVCVYVCVHVCAACSSALMCATCSSPPSCAHCCPSTLGPPLCYPPLPNSSLGVMIE